MARSTKTKTKDADKPRRTCTVSDAGLQARRANSLRSTGPRSQDGRRRAALNAVTHGCYAESDILDDESPEDFQQHVDLFLNALGADSDLERLHAYDAA